MASHNEPMNATSGTECKRNEATRVTSRDDAGQVGNSERRNVTSARSSHVVVIFIFLASGGEKAKLRTRLDSRTAVLRVPTRNIMGNVCFCKPKKVFCMYFSWPRIIRSVIIVGSFFSVSTRSAEAFFTKSRILDSHWSASEEPPTDYSPDTLAEKAVTLHWFFFFSREQRNGRG